MIRRLLTGAQGPVLDPKPVLFPLPATLELWYNSTRPFGGNDGAVWRGRGLTAAVQGGGGAAWRGLSVVFAPDAFWTDNRPYPLVPVPAGSPYANPDAPRLIDRPQRFGDRNHYEIGPGQSTIRIDAFGMSAGFSTANQSWGPMAEFPYLLSNNAAGIPHVFAGSSHPWNVVVGHVHGRIIYSSLAESDFSPAHDSASRRFASGVVAVFSPRFAPGLEIGAGRFFHRVWPSDGLSTSDLLKPAEGLLKSRVRVPQNPLTPDQPNQDIYNQLGSVFARWVLPRSGFELYAEYGREDHSWDTSDLLQEPDHTASIGVGAARVWRSAAGSLVVIRAEGMNFEASHLRRNRSQPGTYQHFQVRQGHTHRGQLLGAGFGSGYGAASMISVERSAPSDRLALSWMRSTPFEQQGPSSGPPAKAVVQHSLSVDRTTRHGGLELTASATAIYDINREYTGADAGAAALSVRLRWLGRGRNGSE